MSSRIWAIGVFVGLFCLAGVLIAIELGMGARDYGEVATTEPCTEMSTFEGEGIDGTVQRIVLSGLAGAACELDVSREEFIVSFGLDDPPVEIDWDDETIEEATRAGLLRALEDEQARGSIGSLEALLLREVVERAPIDLIIQGAGTLVDLLN